MRNWQITLRTRSSRGTGRNQRTKKKRSPLTLVKVEKAERTAEIQELNDENARLKAALDTAGFQYPAKKPAEGTDGAQKGPTKAKHMPVRGNVITRRERSRTIYDVSERYYCIIQVNIHRAHNRRVIHSAQRVSSKSLLIP